MRWCFGSGNELSAETVTAHLAPTAGKTRANRTAFARVSGGARVPAARAGTSMVGAVTGTRVDVPASHPSSAASTSGNVARHGVRLRGGPNMSTTATAPVYALSRGGTASSLHGT